MGCGEERGFVNEGWKGWGRRWSLGEIFGLE